ncbi:MAG: cobyrinate a,c-diamide synthase [Lachnospiraceae bacterium]|nr:cobyrinate a,c-diamide synthase [Lachnospiraceae bacterium]
MTDSTGNSIPSIMVAASSSGSGKTVITCGLLEILKRRGFSPVSFKCGPDYIDPMFHRTVLGIRSQNLDTYLAGPDGVKDIVSGITLNAGSEGADIAVIEGVMGIFDGISPDSDKGSCYEIAKLTKTPMILAVDAQGAGRTVISIIKGILEDDGERLIKGIILNRMSSGYYEKILPIITKEIGAVRDDVKVIGHIPKSDEMRIESRYLGLVLPHETDGLKQKVGTVADIIEKYCDVPAIIKIAEQAVTTRESGKEFLQKDRKNRKEQKNDSKKAPEVIHGGTVKLAVARDAAFCFYYEQNLKLFRDLGVSLEFFSPIHDKRLPEGVSGMLLGGGYPELHLKELSSNKAMLESVKSATDSGMPSLAECGGFMYLHRYIEGPDRKEYEMVGTIDGVCRNTGHLVRFGYAKITGPARYEESGRKDQGDFAATLSGMRGHEFHYYDSTADNTDMILEKASTGSRYESMIENRYSLWGFLHLYYPSDVEAVCSFIEGMRKYGNS